MSDKKIGWYGYEQVVMCPCSYCKGVGYTETYNVYDPEYCEKETCPVCDGKGHTLPEGFVKKSTGKPN